MQCYNRRSKIIENVTVAIHERPMNVRWRAEDTPRRKQECQTTNNAVNVEGNGAGAGKTTFPIE